MSDISVEASVKPTSNVRRNVHSDPMQTEAIFDPSGSGNQQSHETSPVPEVEIVTDTKISIDLSGLKIYQTYLKQPVERLLKPLFFVSSTTDICSIV